MLLATPKLANGLLSLETTATHTVGGESFINQGVNQGVGAVSSPDSGFYSYLWQQLQSTGISELPPSASTGLSLLAGQRLDAAVESGNALPPSAVPAGNTMPLRASGAGLGAVPLTASPAMMSLALPQARAGQTATAGEQRQALPAALPQAGQPPPAVPALLQTAVQASTVHMAQDTTQKQVRVALAVADPNLGGVNHLQSHSDSMSPWLRALEGSRVMSWPDAGQSQPEMVLARTTSPGVVVTGTLGTTLGSLGPQTTGVAEWVNPTTSMPTSAGTPLPTLDHPQWGQVLAQRVSWLTGHQTQVASLRLDPPELGPLQVRITLDKDQASVSFIAQHQPVRDAVEAALPRLREMFAASDLQLINVDVQQHSQERGVDQQSAQSQPAMGEISLAVVDEELDPAALEIAPKGLVDYYA